MTKIHIKLMQNNDDTLPKLLGSFRDENLSSLVEIVKACIKKYPTVGRLIIEIVPYDERQFEI